MPTNLNKSNLKGLGETSDTENIEKAIGKADTTLGSVERIAGKVENIMGMLTKFKGMGKQEEAPISLAPKIEAGVQKGVNEKIEAVKQNAKIKINSEKVVLQLDEFLNNLEETKTIKEIKQELEKAKKLGMINKLVEAFILKNCEVEYG